MDSGILSLLDVSFSYPGSGQVVDGLTFHFGEGEFACLLGANGSGKSTILKLSCGILTPENGIVKLWNKPLNEYRGRDKAKLLSYMPQNLHLIAPFRVREVVEMGLYPYDIPPLLTVDDAIGMVGLSDKKEVAIGNLSGGERRRAFIAMTLVQGAGILLMDEPLANLDIRYQVEIIKLLRDIKGVTTAMALHDINLAFRFDAVVLIQKGRILAKGTPEEVITEELLQEAFDVKLKLMRHGPQTFISYQ
jgi:iron complex transport system ATP-binding protein